MKCCIKKYFYLAIIVLFYSCTTTQYIPVEKNSTDTIYKSTIIRDSLWLHDSIYVRETSSGDTVFLNIEKWHTKYVTKEVHDTLYKARVDSIPVPYEVIKEVPAPLSWWQKTQMIAGDVMLIVLIVFIGLKIVKRKFMR